MPYPRTWRFMPVSSSEGFIVLALTCRSLIHLSSFFYVMCYPHDPRPFVEKMTLFHWIVLSLCWKLGDHRYVVSFFLPVLVLVPHCLDHCHYVESVKSRRVCPPPLFLKKKCLALLGPFQFQMWILESAYLSMKKSAGILIGIVSNL